MKKIESILPSQWEECYAMRQSIYDLCVTPTDHELAEKAVIALYTHAGKPIPKVYFCKSPLEGALMIGTLKRLIPELNNAGSATRNNLDNNFSVCLGHNVKDTLKDSLRGNFDPRNDSWENLADELKGKFVSQLWFNLGRNLSNLKGNLKSDIQKNLDETIDDDLWKSLWINPDTNLNGVEENITVDVCNNLRSVLGTVIGDSLRNRVATNLRTGVWDILGSRIKDKLGISLMDNTKSNLENKAGDINWIELWDSLWAEFWDSLWTDTTQDIIKNLKSSINADLRDYFLNDLVNNFAEMNLDALKTDLIFKLRADLKLADLEVSLRRSLGHNVMVGLWSSIKHSRWTVLMDFYWAKSQFAYYAAGVIAGAKHDPQKWEMYKLIVQNLDIILPFEDICIVCDRPVKISWHDTGGIHCEDGPAVEYADGYSLWAIEGYLVPKQVVMAPETQTLEEIHLEKNEEIKRIRINRYGWGRYVVESSAELLDFSMPRYGGMESLFKTTIGVVLCTCDPSTGRPYSLEVPPSTTTCEEAQRYLLALDVSFGRHGINANDVQTYPPIRA